MPLIFLSIYAFEVHGKKQMCGSTDQARIQITEQVSVFMYYNHLSLRREEEKKAYNDKKQTNKKQPWQVQPTCI